MVRQTCPQENTLAKNRSKRERKTWERADSRTQSHGRRFRGIPRADGFIERGGAREHETHVRHEARVPSGHVVAPRGAASRRARVRAVRVRRAARLTARHRREACVHRVLEALAVTIAGGVDTGSRVIAGGVGEHAAARHAPPGLHSLVHQARLVDPHVRWAVGGGGAVALEPLPSLLELVPQLLPVYHQSLMSIRSYIDFSSWFLVLFCFCFFLL